MKQLCLTLALLLSLTHHSFAGNPATQPAKHQLPCYRDFTLTPVAPSIPALKYRLLPERSEEHPGNAAASYLRASLMIGEDDISQIEKAWDDRSNAALFDAEVKKISDNQTYLLRLLQTASLRDHCDWDSEIGEDGIYAPMPQLNKLRGVEDFVQLCAMRQMRAGQIDDAVDTLRMGYALAHNIGQDPILVGNLVALGCTEMMDNTTTELMNQSDAPNLYWALSAFPRPLFDFNRMIQGERTSLFAMIPVFAKARSGNFTAEQWPELLADLKTYSPKTAPYTDQEKMAQTKLIDTEILPAAQLYYAATRHLSKDETAKLDPQLVLITYNLETFQSVCDDEDKFASYPYPQLIPALANLAKQMREMKTSSIAAMMIGVQVPTIARAAKIFAIQDRDIAALTTVEAIRSYTAANNGGLPATLDAIIDTPAPLNPWTGKAFDYSVNNNIAIISDMHDTEFPLQFTIRIRH